MSSPDSVSSRESLASSTQAAPAWEVEAFWRESCGEDPRASFLAREVGDWLDRDGVHASVSDLYYLRGGALDESALATASQRLLSDPVVQTCEVRPLGAPGDGSASGSASAGGGHVATVRKKTGVMEPAEASLLRGLADIGIEEVEVRLASRIRFGTSLDATQRQLVAEKILSNPAI